jgi:lysophospholipase L1-like esterase
VNLFRLSASLCGLAVVAAPAFAAEPFELKDGDRVVLVGGTLIEREQRYGYWEAALTSRYPDKNITFRNLGWSGDDVWGDARASFGTRADGFKALIDHVLTLKPTVIIMAYGGNESFDGPAGLPQFKDGLNVLLDALAPAKARIVLLAPFRMEDLGRPLPDPTAENKNIRLYTDALRETAKKRDLIYADINPYLGDGPKAAPLTDDGLHLTGAGYWRSAFALEQALGISLPPWELEMKDDGVSEIKPKEGDDGTTQHFKAMLYKPTDRMLPLAPPPADGPARPTPSPRVVRDKVLVPGRYTLNIDGKANATPTTEEWAKGVTLTHGPEYDQAEQLRQAIVAKNRLYFYRWRPSNETYLFGFRKGEQGQNAIEIPKFDPLIVEKEKEIAKLRIPTPHTYAITRGTDK